MLLRGARRPQLDIIDLKDSMRLKSSFCVLLGLCVVMPMAAEAASVNLTPAPLSSTEKAIESIGTAVAIAEPVIAGSYSVYEDDWVGVQQLIVETGLTVGTAIALKQVVRERRPDGSDFSSFPSNTTALAASGSSYLWGRYGWQYGLPALLATGFVGYSRVQAKQHHWYDTLASEAISAGYGFIVTKPFQRRNFYTDLTASPDGAYLRFSYAW